MEWGDFERRLVQNTLLEMQLLDEAKGLIGREPKNVNDLWAVIKADSARPIGEQLSDISDILTEKVNAISKVLSLKKKR